MAFPIERKFDIELSQWGEFEKMAEAVITFPRINFSPPQDIVFIDYDTGNSWCRIQQRIDPCKSQRFTARFVKPYSRPLRDMLLGAWGRQGSVITGDLNFDKLEFMFLHSKLEGNSFEFFEPNYYGVNV